VLSTSKQERLNDPPFDRLRVNGFFFLWRKGRKLLVSSVYTIMDRLITQPDLYATTGSRKLSEISERVQKSLITYLPAGRQGL
jgi:hypothetical protein